MKPLKLGTLFIYKPDHYFPPLLIEPRGTKHIGLILQVYKFTDEQKNDPRDNASRSCADFGYMIKFITIKPTNNIDFFTLC